MRKRAHTAMSPSSPTFVSSVRPAGRRLALFLALLPALVQLGACTTLDVPKADNYPVSSQKKARTVQHWDILAEDVAARVAAKLQATGEEGAPVYVAPVGDTSFGQGFRSLLLARLADKGLRLSAQPGGLQLEYEAQLIEHGAALPSNLPLPASTLAGGIVVARDLLHYEHTVASGVLGALAVGGAIDAASWVRQGSAAGGPTRTELLVSTALRQGEAYLARTADIYYIEGADAGLYRPAPPPSAAKPLKAWKVVGP